RARPARHPLGFDTATDLATIVVTVPDPDATRPALAAEVSDPSRLRVEATTLAQHERINLMEQLDPVVGQHGNVLLGDHVVEAELFPFEEELAAQLVRDHGTEVRVTVAGFAFPYHYEDRCPAIPPPPPPGVDVTLDVQTA